MVNNSLLFVQLLIEILEHSTLELYLNFIGSWVSCNWFIIEWIGVENHVRLLACKVRNVSYVMVLTINTLFYFKTVFLSFDGQKLK